MRCALQFVSYKKRKKSSNFFSGVYHLARETSYPEKIYIKKKIRDLINVKNDRHSEYGETARK